VAGRAHGIVVPGTQPDACRVAEIQRNFCVGSYLHRAIARQAENLKGQRPMWIVSGNVERTGIDEDGNPEDPDYSGNDQLFDRFHKLPSKKGYEEAGLR